MHTIEQWGPNDWRIRFQSANPSFWHYSRSFATRSEAADVLARFVMAR